MTDARLPGHWLHEPVFDGLSDRAWRTFAACLMWSNQVGSDGDIPTRSLRLLHPEGVDDATAAELVVAGKWKQTDTGYKVIDWSKSQSKAADVERRRKLNRDRVKEWRNGQKQADDIEVSESTTPTDQPATVDVTRGVTHYERDDVRSYPVGQDKDLRTAARLGTQNHENNSATTTKKPEDKPPGNPTCTVCGKPNLFSPLSIGRGVCAKCVLAESGLGA